MDNLEINPSEFYYARRDIKLSIDELEDVKELLTSINNLDYDVSIYFSRVEAVDRRLNTLYDKLKKLASEMVKMDTSIGSLFQYLNVDDSQDFKIDDFNKDNNEKQLDELKGNNNDLGAKKSNHSSSILKEEERVLDTLKGGRKGLGGHVTNKASSLLLRGVK